MRKEQRAALQHALDALADGAGHEVWGPGIVGQKLWDAKHAYAATAFDQAASTLVMMGGQSSALGIRIRDRKVIIAHMRTLAPVLFDILLPPEP